MSSKRTPMCSLCQRACVLKSFGPWKGLEGVRASSPHLPKGLCVEIVWALEGFGRVWKACGLAARTCLRACVLKSFGHWKGLEGVRASSPHLPKGLCVEIV